MVLTKISDENQVPEISSKALHQNNVQSSLSFWPYQAFGKRLLRRLLRWRISEDLQAFEMQKIKKLKSFWKFSERSLKKRLINYDEREVFDFNMLNSAV